MRMFPSALISFVALFVLVPLVLLGVLWALQRKLIYLPFGKLMHSFLAFGSRYTTGYTFTRKGARV